MYQYGHYTFYLQNHQIKYQFIKNNNTFLYLFLKDINKSEVGKNEEEIKKIKKLPHQHPCQFQAILML